jgi:metallophosphoesterase (TIGR00282 family)
VITVLSIGDVVGKAGRRSIQELLPIAREKFSPDIVIANGENAAGGFGLNKKVYNQFVDKFEIDCITTGNHWKDKPEILSFIDDSPNLLLPANMYNVDSLEQGYAVLKAKDGSFYAVINLYGRAFMKGENRCPFKAVDEILEKIPKSIKVIIVDIHAEVTSEKQALGHYLAGKVSAVYGTHTHCPTADERILDDHTGFLTDLGMTGAYDSVIGIRKEAAINRLKNGIRKNFEPAKNDPWLCFAVFNIERSSGRCTKIERLRWELNKMISK